MYVALQNIKTKHGLIKPGEPVPTDGWGQSVIMAHLNAKLMAPEGASQTPVAKIALKVPGRIIQPGEPVPEFHKWGEAVKRNHLNFGWIEFPAVTVVESKASAEPKAKKSKKSKK